MVTELEAVVVWDDWLRWAEAETLAEEAEEAVARAGASVAMALSRARRGEEWAGEREDALREVRAALVSLAKAETHLSARLQELAKAAKQAASRVYGAVAEAVEAGEARAASARLSRLSEQVRVFELYLITVRDYQDAWLLVNRAKRALETVGGAPVDRLRDAEEALREAEETLAPHSHAGAALRPLVALTREGEGAVSRGREVAKATAAAIAIATKMMRSGGGRRRAVAEAVLECARVLLERLG
jgi:chromosome segregation ATPase